MALVNNGLSSRALLYAAHPGTAPPRATEVGSRNNGLLKAVSLRNADGLATMPVAFFNEGLLLTPKALLTTKDEIKRTDASFMVVMMMISFFQFSKNDVQMTD